MHVENEIVRLWDTDKNQERDRKGIVGRVKKEKWQQEG